MTAANFDIIIYGATSFVGEITVEYFLKQYGVDNEDIKWAIAARSAEKLEALKSSLGKAAESIPTLVANSSDEKSLTALCEKTKLIISTVGPYAYYGEPLVKACVESGTHYCDLTGEPLWIEEMIDKYESIAIESGAKIVHCCGFDSIPSDLGNYFLQQASQERFGEACTQVELGVKAARGGMSGGTIASLMNAVEETSKNPALRKKASNPYVLCPKDHDYTTRQRTNAFYESKNLKSWCAPFVMAAINTKVVHRSNALLNDQYGKDFKYSEYTMTGAGAKGRLRALGMTGGMGGFMALISAAPTRKLLAKFALPKPGEGPSKSEQENGFFNLWLAGETKSGNIITIKVTGDRDPGYGSTAKMLSEAAICILETDASGGFWTPSSMMGQNLIDRLVANAGLTFEII